MGGGAPSCPTAGIKPAVGSSHRPPARPGRYIFRSTAPHHIHSLIIIIIETGKRPVLAESAHTENQAKIYYRGLM